MSLNLECCLVIDTKPKYWGKILLVFCLAIATLNTNAQDDEVKSFSALKKSADGAEKANDVHAAIGFLEKMVELKPEHYKTNLKLARLSVSVSDYNSALDFFETCYELDKNKVPEVLYERSEALKNLGRYDEAKKSFSTFISKHKRDVDLKPLRKQAEAAVLSCDLAKLLMEKQLNVDVDRLPNVVNGPHIEFNPFYLNSQTLVYGALKETEVRSFDLDSLVPVRSFYYADKSSGEWESKGEWNAQISNEFENTGNGAFNKDSTLFFFSKCVEDWRGKMACSIYQAAYVNGQVQEPILLGAAVNQEGSSNSQPAIGYESRLGRMVMYFVSDREGGKGGKDIWVSQFDPKKNKFKVAKNLGRKLNSSFDEITPFFDNTRKKLFFSSDHIKGLGGFDVFEVRGENRSFGVPKNVGYPLNTNADEIYFKVNNTGDQGLFTSNRSGSSQMFHPTCCDDIYEFTFRDYVILAIEGLILEIPEEEYIQGKGDNIKDLSSYPKINNADISIFLFEDGEEILISEMETSRNGEYFLQLEEGKDYRIEVSKPAYYSNNFEVSTRDKTFSDTLEVNMGIAKLGEGVIVIPNIYYDFDSSDLRQESKDSIMTSIYQVLLENPTFKIEIGSHTDSRGADDYNQVLSQERAESVVEFLIFNGIEASRLEAQGYGESNPVAPNENKDGSDNPDGRQLNRRTEFKILELNSGTF